MRNRYLPLQYTSSWNASYTTISRTLGSQAADLPYSRPTLSTSPQFILLRTIDHRIGRQVVSIWRTDHVQPSQTTEEVTPISDAPSPSYIEELPAEPPHLHSVPESFHPLHWTSTPRCFQPSTILAQCRKLLQQATSFLRKLKGNRVPGPSK